MMHPEQVNTIVETHLDCHVRERERLTGGRMARTYLLRLDTRPQRVVCKVGGPSVRTGEVIEPLVVALIETTMELPVPAVLASGTTDGTDWALYEFCDGQTPDYNSLAPSTRRAIVTEIGSMLGKLHATHQFERTGGLARLGDQLCIRDPKGLNMPERGRRLVRPFVTGDEQPVLSHGDLFPGNLLVNADGTITGLLDWGNAHVTTAGYALGRAEMRFIDWFRFAGRERNRLRTALRDGYTDHRSLPPDYPRLTGVYKGLWLAQSADRILRHLRTRRGRRQLRRHFRSLLS